jgi:hypothetical protein
MTDTPSNEHAGKALRDLENARAWEPVKVEVAGFEVLREYSQAWHEDRSTAYLLRKNWADRFNRFFLITLITVILVGWVFLLSL